MIHETIIQQLGGIGRLKAMIAAYNFVSLENGLMFMFKGNRKMNKIIIELNNDLYDITIGKVKGCDFIEKASLKGIYAEDMIRIIEQETGLYLRFQN